MSPIKSSVTRWPVASDSHLQAVYLDLLPRIREIARGYFRGVRCADQKQDMVAEAVALGWLWFVRLAARQKDPAAFTTAFAYTLARAVNSGRRLAGSETMRDVLSPVCRRRRRFTVSPLPDGSAMIGNVFDDALRENRQTPVPLQVQFRIDFGRFRRSLPARRRRILDTMAAGERTIDLAERYRLSEGRVSQLRREFRAAWVEFCSK